MAVVYLFFLVAAMSAPVLGSVDPGLQGTVLITEIMAANDRTLADEDGDYSDWIELHNAGSSAVQLQGFLTDSRANLTRWAFPVTHLDPGEYLVVFASGKNRAVSGMPLHTSFSLDAQGEYLALVAPDGATVVSELEFGPQRPNVSYGLAQGLPGSTPNRVFFSEATPGQPNRNGYIGFVTQPRLSAERGFYEKPVDVTLTNDTPGTEFRYTLDGSPPGPGARVDISVSLPDRNGDASGVAGFDRVYTNGTAIGLTAPLSSGGYVFEKWQKDGVDYSTNATIETSVDTNQLWHAVYTKGPLAVHHVPEAANYSLVYSLNIPSEADYNTNAIPYEVDTHATAAAFSRIAYYLELAPANGGPVQYLWVSMDAFTTDAAKIGVPNVQSRAFFQQPATRMNIRSSVAGIVTGDDLPGGYLEFWSDNYGPENSRNVPGASSVVYDFGDRAPGAVVSGYGSMQVHNLLSAQTLFAFNGWGGVPGYGIDLGIGNSSGQHPDWTFAQNGGEYVTKKLQVYILPLDPAEAPKLSSLPASRSTSVEHTVKATSVTANPSSDGQELWTVRVIASNPESGLPYTRPLLVDTTRTLRVAGFKPGWYPSTLATHTYLFISDVLRQPAAVPGYPQPLMETSVPWILSQKVKLDYEMDPNVVGAAAYRDVIARGMRSIPSMSLVGRVDDILGPGGVYFGNTVSGGPERPISMEVLYPEDPAQNVQANAGLRPQSYPYLKRSFRLLFREEYGNSKLRSDLLRRTPWNNAETTLEFDRLALRAGGNRSFVTRWNPDDTCYTRDEWMRASQIAMTGMGSRGTFVHLYINGLYWGLYNPTERPDHFFAAQYFGGDRDDYFAVSHSGPISGDATRWTYLIGILKNKDLTLQANYDELKEYLDVTQFCDYLLLNWYAGTVDWPENNWYASMRVSPTPTPLRFFQWDAEDTWDDEGSTGPFDCKDCSVGTRRGHDGAWIPPGFVSRASKNNGPAIAQLFNAAKANADFRMLLADRAYRHVRSGGPLSDSAAQARWIQINEFIRDAIVGESARWGDAREVLPGEAGVIRDRDGVWQSEYLRILNQSIPGNGERLIAALRAEGYFPKIDPPRFNHSGGPISPGYQLELSAPEGVIYYSLDGSDPRPSTGGGASNRIEYGGPITLNSDARVIARVLVGDEWSALAEAEYRLETPGSPLVLAGEDQEIILPAVVKLAGSLQPALGCAVLPVVRWEVLTGAAGVVFGDLNSSNTVARFTNPGEYRLRLTAEACGSSGSSEITVNVLDSFAAWRDRYFPDGGPMAEADADPDGDGLVNLVEYAVHSDPRAPESSHPLSTTVRRDSVDELEYLELGFERPRSPRDLAYTIDTSEDFQLWSSEPASFLELSVVSLPGGAAEQVTLRVLPPVKSLSKRFVRIGVRRVEQPATVNDPPPPNGKIP